MIVIQMHSQRKHLSILTAGALLERYLQVYKIPPTVTPKWAEPCFRNCKDAGQTGIVLSFAASLTQVNQ